MARWYCVKENKQTECVQRSDYKTAKNCKKLTTRKSKRRRVISNGVDEIWSADPVFMDKLSKRNKGFKYTKIYILTVLDLFSKFAWTIPLNHPSGFRIPFERSNF